MENIWIAAWRQFDIAGKLILVLLVCLSFYSWYVILERFFFLREVERKNRIFQLFIKKGKKPRISNCPLNSILSYGIELRDKVHDDSLDMHLQKAFLKEQGNLERNLTVLGTIATVAPFLGLLGTVWGLLLSFQGIVSAGASSVRIVAGGVSIALTTTIVGLMVAIPAAIGYNYYRDRVMNILEKMEFFFPYILQYLESFADRENGH